MEQPLNNICPRLFPIFLYLFSGLILTHYNYFLRCCLSRHAECTRRLIDKQFCILRAAGILLSVQRHYISHRSDIQFQRTVG